MQHETDSVASSRVNAYWHNLSQPLLKSTCNKSQIAPIFIHGVQKYDKLATIFQIQYLQIFNILVNLWELRETWVTSPNYALLCRFD